MARVGVQSLRGQPSGGSTPWWAWPPLAAPPATVASRPFPALLNQAFFQVKVMRWASEEWALEATAKGSCVYIDLKLIKFGSSSSSVGRPRGLPPGLLLLESFSTFSFRIHCHCKKQNNSIFPTSSRELVTQLWRWSGECKQWGSQRCPDYNFPNKGRFGFYIWTLRRKSRKAKT